MGFGGEVVANGEGLGEHAAEDASFEFVGEGEGFEGIVVLFGCCLVAYLEF